MSVSQATGQGGGEALIKAEYGNRNWPLPPCGGRQAGGVERDSKRGSHEVLGLQWARKGPQGVFWSRLVTPPQCARIPWGTGFSVGSQPPPSIASPVGGVMQGDLLLYQHPSFI